MDVPAAADVIASGGEGLPPWLRRWPGKWLGTRTIRPRPVVVLVLAAVIAGSTLFVMRFMRSEPASGITTTAASGANGVFAEGTAGAHRWRLAVRDIAGPGYQCVPGVTLNGSDAAPVTPATAGRPAFIALNRQTGFAFIQLAADASLVWLDPADGQRIRTAPVNVTACGQRFRLAGFAYPLTAPLRMHIAYADRPVVTITTPTDVTNPRPSLAEPQVTGVWQTEGGSDAALASALLAAGRAVGQPWSIRMTFGLGGDCFALASGFIDDSANARPDWNLTCGPVSVPGGPDLAVALPLAAPEGDGPGIGYAFSLGPGTTGLIATLSGGRTITAHPVVVDGRKYAAFFVAAPSRLTGLTFVTAHGRHRTSALPGYGYVQLKS